jgi:hypothetical protein
MAGVIRSIRLASARIAKELTMAFGSQYSSEVVKAAANKMMATRKALEDYDALPNHQKLQKEHAKLLKNFEDATRLYFVASNPNPKG